MMPRLWEGWVHGGLSRADLCKLALTTFDADSRLLLHRLLANKLQRGRSALQSQAYLRQRVQAIRVCVDVLHHAQSGASSTKTEGASAGSSYETCCYFDVTTLCRALRSNGRLWLTHPRFEHNLLKPRAPSSCSASASDEWVRSATSPLTAQISHAALWNQEGA